MPQWFVRKRALKSEERKPIEIQAEQEQERRLTWKEWFVGWLQGGEPRAYAVSFVLHLVVLASLSFVLIRSAEGPIGLSTLVGFNGDDAELLPLDGVETTIEIEGGANSADSAVDPLAEYMASADMPGQLDADLLAAFSGHGTGEGQGDHNGNGTGAGRGFAMPKSGKFVTKGSFTAWTVPEDPKPGETYSIVIQVDYGKSGKRLRSGDVTGSVGGTDGYRKNFDSKNALYIPKAGQIIVKIPGAAENIRDVIKCRSESLNESQQLEIVF
jgi:hypothetical protein